MMVRLLVRPRLFVVVAFFGVTFLAATPVEALKAEEDDVVVVDQPQRLRARRIRTPPRNSAQARILMQMKTQSTQTSKKKPQRVDPSSPVLSPIHENSNDDDDDEATSSTASSSVGAPPNGFQRFHQAPAVPLPPPVPLFLPQPPFMLPLPPPPPLPCCRIRSECWPRVATQPAVMKKKKRRRMKAPMKHMNAPMKNTNAFMENTNAPMKNMMMMMMMKSRMSQGGAGQRQMMHPQHIEPVTSHSQTHNRMTMIQKPPPSESRLDGRRRLQALPEENYNSEIPSATNYNHGYFNYDSSCWNCSCESAIQQAGQTYNGNMSASRGGMDAGSSSSVNYYYPWIPPPKAYYGAWAYPKQELSSDDD